MNRDKIMEPTGFVIAGITALFSLFLFYNDTHTFLGSLSAALMAAGLAWMTYTILRLLFLTFRR